jgi:histidinol-phosphate aminotransferase
MQAFLHTKLSACSASIQAMSTYEFGGSMRTSTSSNRSQETNGLTRRDFARAVVFLGAASALPFYNEMALAQDIKAIAAIPLDAVRINANENPMGPCPAAIEAVRALAPQGGRYHFDQTHKFVVEMAAVENLPETHVQANAGSSDPLHRAVLAFTGPGRPLVTADPGYEAPERPAQFMKARVIRVPLRKDYSHDVKAMVEASPTAGVIYMCNPNNPTGTVTTKLDIDYVVANKPKGCLVLIDEAYIHFAPSATPATDHVAAGKDVMVLRTFSKLYGMAGLRAGAALARPDLLEKLRGFGGLGMMPATGMVAAIASLKEKNLVIERRKILTDIRNDLFAWMREKGYEFIPSEANMVMINARRPGPETAAAMLAQKVAIGRAWPTLPTYVRVTIGTAQEMEKFKAAFQKVMAS